MPLLDHFRPPLHPGRRWTSFLAHWSVSISDALNANDALNGSALPEGYFSEVRVRIGGRMEIEFGGAPPDSWQPCPPALAMPAIYPDTVDVLVYNSEAILVSAVELITPGNKERPDTCRAFAAKSAALLQQGVGLVIVDIVTSRRANLHNALADLLDVGETFLLPLGPLYAVSYRPIRRQSKRDEPLIEQTHVWPAALAVGEKLPVIPLSLDRGVCLPLDLESTYTDARQRLRLG